MAEFLARRVSPRRVVLLAAVVVAGGVAAGGVAVATSGSHGTGSPAPGGSAATAAVVRTDLVATVQEGGSLGYDGASTVAAPSGASAQQVAQAQQAVAQDRQAVAADEQAGSDASAAGDQAIAAARADVTADQSALAAARSAAHKDCAGASDPACRQDEQDVTQAQAALTGAWLQLGTAESTAKTGDDQAQAKTGADQVKLRGDEVALAALRATAVNPGTTYTWLPSAGQVIRQDQRVYAVSGEPVPLLYGSIAAYRAFYLGMPDGGDVGELTRDLIATGYGDGLTRSDHYSPATAAAVRRWQRARGLPATGEILLGEVVFEPGPIRVTSVTPSPGSAYGSSGSTPSASGAVLTATGTTPVVTVDLDVSQEYLVKPGDAVSVVLPDGTSAVGGHVQSVGTVATCPGGGGSGTGTAGSGGSPCASAGSGGGSGTNSPATVTVTITLDRTPPGATLDQAPVNVNITQQRADDVLAVPVNALLALAGGGYGVQVVTGSGASHLIAVTTGLYSDTLVQVSGTGLNVGTRVEVPSQ